MLTTRIYIKTDSNFPGFSEKCYAYRLECWMNGTVRTDKRDPRFGKIKGTFNQVVLKILIEAFGRFKCPCVVYIHSENQFVLNSIKTDLKNWAETQFTRTCGEPVANKEEWEMLWGLLQKHEVYTVPGGHIHSKILKEQLDAWKEGTYEEDI